MHHAHFEPLWVAPKAHSIADWLIFLYEIQDGRGLSSYLGIRSGVNNHDAVRLWVHQKMHTRPKEFQTLGDLRTNFARLLPDATN
jgi:hypothetical protein